MNPRQGKKSCFQVETLEGRIALSSAVPTSGLENVRAPAVVTPLSVVTPPYPDGITPPGVKAISEAKKWQNKIYDSSDPFSDYFHRSDNDRGEWCADFVSFCFEKTGNPIGKKGHSSDAGFGSVKDMVAWFRKRGAWDDTHSRPVIGAVVAFDWPNTGMKYDHVGIVTKVTGSQITYISGNTSGPHGHTGVFEHPIARSSNQIIGYGYR